MKRLSVVLLLLGLAALCAQADPALSLIPTSGIIDGLPGDTVGWGFTVTNDNTGYLVFTGAEFDTTSPMVSFTPFAGYSPSPVILGPGEEYGEPFSAGDQTGIGSITILPNTPHGLIGGTIYLTYSVFSVSPDDPSFVPETDTLTADGRLEAPAGVNVVPEPGSLWLLAGAGLFLLRRRRS